MTGLAVGAWGLIGTGAVLVVGLLVLEVGPVCSWLAPKVVRRATRRLPEKYREVREEEWLAELASMEAGMKITRLLYALGTIAAVLKMLSMPSVRAALKQEMAETDQQRATRALWVAFRRGFERSFRKPGVDVDAEVTIVSATGSRGRGILTLGDGTVKDVEIDFVGLDADPSSTFRLPKGARLRIDDDDGGGYSLVRRSDDFDDQR